MRRSVVTNGFALRVSVAWRRIWMVLFCVANALMGLLLLQSTCETRTSHRRPKPSCAQVRSRTCSRMLGFLLRFLIKDRSREGSGEMKKKATLSMFSPGHTLPHHGVLCYRRPILSRIRTSSMKPHHSIQGVEKVLVTQHSCQKQLRHFYLFPVVISTPFSSHPRNEFIVWRDHTVSLSSYTSLCNRALDDDYSIATISTTVARRLSSRVFTNLPTYVCKRYTTANNEHILALLSAFESMNAPRLADRSSLVPLWPLFGPSLTIRVRRSGADNLTYTLWCAELFAFVQRSTTGAPFCQYRGSSSSCDLWWAVSRP